jgi:hypothetical protein
MFCRFQKSLITFTPLAAVLVLLNWNLSLAQQPNTSSTNRSHSLFDGSKALQFRITDNFVLNSFQGAALSGKKHISANSAFRLGADLFFNFSSAESGSRVYSSDTTVTTYDSDINAQRIILELQYIRYVSTDRKIKFFWGTGPTVRFNRAITETDYYESWSDTSIVLKDEDKSWGLGGSGVLGIEWFARSDISFHAEYAVALLYEWRETRDEEFSGIEFRQISTKNSGFQAYASSVRFGLSLYF